MCGNGTHFQYEDALASVSKSFCVHPLLRVDFSLSQLLQCSLPIVTISELGHSRLVLIFLLYIFSIKNLPIGTKPRVKPLFCNIDERGNKTSRSMSCPTEARQRHIFSLCFPTNESMCLLNACVLNLAFRQ